MSGARALTADTAIPTKTTTAARTPSDGASETPGSPPKRAGRSGSNRRRGPFSGSDACGDRARSRGDRRSSGPAVRGDGLDGALEGQSVNGSPSCGSKAKMWPHRGHFRSGRSLYLQSLWQWMHFMRPLPAGDPGHRRRFAATPPASPASTVARRCAGGASRWPRPCPDAAGDVLAPEQPAPGQRRGPSRPSIVAASGPSTHSVIGTLMPNFRRQTMSCGSFFSSTSLRTYFSQAPCSFICGGSGTTPRPARGRTAAPARRVPRRWTCVPCAAGCSANPSTRCPRGGRG